MISVMRRTPMKIDIDTTAKIHDQPSHSSLREFVMASEMSSELISVRLP